MKKILIASVLIFGLAGSANAISIVNGGFETGDFTGWAFGSSGGGSAAVVTNSVAADGTVYTPIEGSYMAELTSTAWILEGQSWSAGETITFNWAWLGFDSLPWNDTGTFEVDDLTPANNDITFTLSSIAIAGPAADTGWQYFSYTFPTAGTGIFTFAANNGLDELVDSKLLIDAVGNGKPVPEPTTMLLLGGGLVGLAGLNRRKRK